jgi:TolB protein
VWSPTSWKIALVSWHPDASDDVFVMNAAGTDPECIRIHVHPCYCWVNLTASRGDDRNPVWSPDGSKIAFHGSRDGGDHEIYVVNADGTGRVNVTNSPGSETIPVWSPDGSKIGFTSLRDGNAEIYVINPDGTGLVNLTNSPAYDEYGQAWSPDGSKIAFHSLQDGDREIYVMNADGTGRVKLTNSPGADAFPVWRPR